MSTPFSSFFDSRLWALNLLVYSSHKLEVEGGDTGGALGDDWNMGLESKVEDLMRKIIFGSYGVFRFMDPLAPQESRI